MVKEFISSKEGVSRKDMKKLAEAGDWKALHSSHKQKTAKISEKSRSKKLLI